MALEQTRALLMRAACGRTLYGALAAQRERSAVAATILTMSMEP